MLYNAQNSWVGSEEANLSVFRKISKLSRESPNIHSDTLFNNAHAPTEAGVPNMSRIRKNIWALKGLPSNL